MKLPFRSLALDDIRTDGGTQVREGLDEAWVAELAELYREGHEIEPVLVVIDPAGVHWLARGFHRVAAKRRLGSSSIMATVREGSAATLDMAKMLAAEAGKDGRPLQPGDKRRAVLMARSTAEGRAMAAQDLARHCGVSVSIVSEILNPHPDHDGNSLADKVDGTAARDLPPAPVVVQHEAPVPAYVPRAAAARSARPGTRAAPPPPPPHLREDRLVDEEIPYRHASAAILGPEPRVVTEDDRNRNATNDGAIVLSAVLADGSGATARQVEQILGPGGGVAFWSDLHMRIWTATIASLTHHGVVELQLVKEAGDLDGRPPIPLSEWEAIVVGQPTVASVVPYVRSMVAHYKRNALRALAERASAECEADRRPIGEVLEAFRAGAQGIAEVGAENPRTQPKVKPPTLAEFCRARAKRSTPPPLPTGLPALDEATRGGIAPESIVCLTGAPGAGKTALAVQWSDTWARAGARVVFLAQDQRPDQIVIRLGQRDGLNRDDLDGRTGPAAEQRAWDELAGRLETVPTLCVLDGADTTLESAISTLRAMPGDGPLVLALDSVQTVLCEEAANAETPRARMDAVVKVLRRARDAGVLVLATSEANRGYYVAGDRSPTDALAAAKESGSIEYAADMLIGLRSVAGSTDEIDATMPKCRFGRTGEFRFRLNRERADLTETTRPPPASRDERGAEREAVKDAKEERDARALIPRIVKVVAASGASGCSGREVEAHRLGRATTVRRGIRLAVEEAALVTQPFRGNARLYLPSSAPPDGVRPDDGTHLDAGEG